MRQGGHIGNDSEGKGKVVSTWCGKNVGSVDRDCNGGLRGVRLDITIHQEIVVNAEIWPRAS